MAAKYKLHITKENKNAYKALISARFVGVELELPASFDMKETKTPEFLKMNPNGKGAIWESNAIARYIARLADVGLFGNTSLDAARVEQWIDFSTLSLDAPIQSWVYPLIFPAVYPYDKKKEEGAKAALKTALAVLNQHLTSNTYLVGEHVTLADIITWSNLVIGMKQVFDKAFRADFPAVERWFLTLEHHPHFSAVVGTFNLCETQRKYTAPPKDKKPAAAAAAPKAAAPKAAAPATPQQTGEEDEPKPKPKAKNPLDELPPSKMLLDSWKRLYSNTPAAKFQEIAIKGLWNGADVPNSLSNEHFEGWDPEGFSMWFIDYKYPEENTVNFIVMNKVGGFLQRIDYVRKYAFAAICILKDNSTGQFPIRGLFIFRGQDIPPIMLEECLDLDLYHWKKVDLSDSAQKKRVEDILSEEATIDGLENVEVKVFK